jgi:hypothetical protein
MSLLEASLCASFFSWGIVIGLPAFGWACGRLAGPLTLLGLGAVMTGASVALILYGPASFIVFSLGMLLCGMANGSSHLRGGRLGGATRIHERGVRFCQYGYSGGRRTFLPAPDRHPGEDEGTRCARRRFPKRLDLGAGNRSASLDPLDFESSRRTGVSLESSLTGRRCD